MTTPNNIQEYIESAITAHIAAKPPNPQPSKAALDLLDKFGLKPEWFTWESECEAHIEIAGEFVAITMFTRYITIHGEGDYDDAYYFARGLEKAAQRKKAQREIDERPIVAIAHNEPWKMVKYQKLGYRFVRTIEYDGMMSVIYVHESHLPDNR